jgi:S1/P1 Nuclease
MKKLTKLFILSCVSLFVLLSGCWAWGKEGHEIIAQIATESLSPTTKEKILSLLHSGIEINQLDTHEKPPYEYIDNNLKAFFTNPTLDLSLIANWADGWKFYDPGKDTYDWHFIDLPVEKDLTKADESDYYNNDSCSVVQIPIQLQILADTTKAPLERVKALLFIVHLTGDLTQPLHNAERDGDKGGNSEKVIFFGTQRKLHQVWDDYILEKGLSTKKAKQDILKISEDQVAEWIKGDIGDWSFESYLIAKKIIYPQCPSDGSVPTYGNDYQNAMYPIAKEQIKKAGVRLANLLNSAFDTK